jgi:predicted DNA-binding ribbon-helix-helix protein
MPTTKSRINVILEDPLYKTVEQLAKHDGMSLSMKVRDLVKEALEIREDIALTSFAEKREKSFRKSKSLKHDEVWQSCHLNSGTILMCEKLIFLS